MVLESLRQVLVGEPKESDIAGHFADRISAMEQQQRIAREEGNLELLTDATNKIIELRLQAHESGLDSEKYRTIFRSG